MACIRTPEAAYGDSDYDIFVAQVPSPLFQRMETAFGDADFDLFAAQVPSPLFQRIGTAVLTVATVASEAVVVESPWMPRRRRVNRQRPCHSRVIMSSSSESSSSLLLMSLFTDSSMKDPCGVCGEGDASGVLLHCEAGGCCTATVHLQCLRSRQLTPPPHTNTLL